MSVSQYALITLAEMRTFPGFASLRASEDAILEALIDAATLDFERFWDNYGVRRPVYAEKHTYREIKRDSPDANEIQLRRYPVLASSGVAIVDSAGNLVGPDEYWIEEDIGQLHTTSGWTIPLDANGFEAYWQCTYVAGRVNSTSEVPANIKTACKMWVADLYKRPDRGLVSKKVGDLSLTYAQQSGEDLPRVIKSMIGQWKKIEV